MRLSVDVQLALDKEKTVAIPGKEQLRQWANRAVDMAGYKIERNTQITVRIVNEKEISWLNSEYRHKDYATNVLSFPFVQPPGIPEQERDSSLGDLVICASVVNREAEEQNVPMTEHWAHMVVHGVLHLLGYDHQDDSEAKVMEALETKIMEELGFDNPYE